MCIASLCWVLGVYLTYPSGGVEVDISSLSSRAKELKLKRLTQEQGGRNP